MKGFLKKASTLFACTMLAFTAVLGNYQGVLTAFKTTKAQASDMIYNPKFSYYQELDEKEKKIYDGLTKMDEDGIFKTGDGSLDLIKNGFMREYYAKEFAYGDNRALSAFAAARDAYYLDHPEIFYVDFDKLTLSFYKKGSSYIAEIGAGRYADYYVDGFTSAEQVETAIAEYYTAVTAIANKAAAAKNDKEAIAQIDKSISEKATYSFDADNTLLGKSAIRTSYGALIKGYAVCEGYARAFKAICDNLVIPCAQVIGFYETDTSGKQPHAWVHVEIGNKYYLADPTFNDNETAEKTLYSGSKSTKRYFLSNAVSNGGHEFNAPELAINDLGINDIETTVTYDKTTEPYSQTITYNYDGYKSAADFLKDGLHLAVRHALVNGDGEVEGWTKPFSLSAMDYPGNTFLVNAKTLSTQFFVTSEAPNSQTSIYNSFDFDKVIAESEVIFNEVYSFANDAPRVLSITPSATTVLNSQKTYEVTIEYEKKIKIQDSAKQIGMFVYSESSENLGKYVKVENMRLADDHSVSFTFTPSKMFEHDSICYRFIPTNVVGVNDQTPTAAMLKFARPWQVCSKVYGDGRLYIDASASPVLIGTSDLSKADFLDENGNQVAENQRSQLVLVVSKVDEDTGNDMLESANKLAVDIKSSSTFELDLNICGGVTQIPKGSYVKLALGFPKGYEFRTGATFEVYHFEKDENGKIDSTKTRKIPCVATEYGIVVIVDSFSPFLVAACTSYDRNVYTKMLSDGGTVTATVTTRTGKTETISEIASLSSGDSITYTFTASDGYTLDYVYLDQRELKVENGKVTVKYDDLTANSQLKVAFISDKASARIKKNGYTPLDKTYLTIKDYVSDPCGRPETRIYLIFSFILIVLFFISALAILILVPIAIVKAAKKRKKGNE